MWKSFTVLSILLIGFVYCQNYNSENLIVVTKLGPIKGSILKTVLGKTIFSFRGVRYAEAPVGELRFQLPVPVKKWYDIYDATKDGPACQQHHQRFAPVSENCLNLNIYTTKLPNHHYNPKRPVIIYLHPGAYYSFTGRSDWAGPQYLLEQDVVFVTINYRLATLGLLSTGDYVAPGNNAFRDQIVAFKWVKDNIATFGGNPDLVTLIGYSAGSSSVTFHLVSPMSRGLFHRGIIMSGSGFGRGETTPHDQLEIAKQEARFVACPDDTSANILKCLKTKTAEEITGTFYKFRLDDFQRILIWQQVIEPENGQERFLPADPNIMLECKQLASVPVMVGSNTKEFASVAYNIAANATLKKKLDENFDYIIPYLFSYEREKDVKNITQKIRKFYFGDGPITRDGLAEAYADARTRYPMNRAATRISVNSKMPVYYYRFDYEGRFSFYTKPGTTTPDGVVHHDDLIYLIYISTMFPILNQTDPEFKMMQRYTKLVANFALTGNPTPTATPFLDNVVWEPFNIKTKPYLQINKQLKMDNNYFTKRFEFWNNLFPVPKCTI